MADEISQALGRIEGKLDQVIDAAREHRDDDKRRFKEVFDVLDQHATDINKAKGAKGVIVWMAGAIGAVTAAAASILAKALGLH